jgi:hypothetical protein
VTNKFECGVELFQRCEWVLVLYWTVPPRVVVTTVARLWVQSGVWGWRTSRRGGGEEKVMEVEEEVMEAEEKVTEGKEWWVGTFAGESGVSGHPLTCPRRPMRKVNALGA